MVTWIPFWQWHSWTPAERGEITTFYENTGQKWAIDLTKDKPPSHDRISDFEEYEGEADDRGVDHRGYAPQGKMQLSRKT